MGRINARALHSFSPAFVGDEDKLLLLKEKI
jgi:hypothetical protein